MRLEYIHKCTRHTCTQMGREEDQLRHTISLANINDMFRIFLCMRKAPCYGMKSRRCVNYLARTSPSCGIFENTDLYKFISLKYCFKSVQSKRCQDVLQLSLCDMF